MLPSFCRRWLHDFSAVGLPASLLVCFLLYFPKGGFKFSGIPFTWGCLLLLLFAGIAACNAVYTHPVSRKHFSAFLYTLPFALLAGCSVLVLGQGNVGFTFSLFYCFLFAPLAFLVLFAPYFHNIPQEALFRLIDRGVLFVAIYGIVLFFYKYYVGEFFTIPYLTINAGDVGMLEQKHIERGTIFKLISTYNNGNVYGVSILMLLPLFHSRNVWWKRWIVKTSLVLSLSRTVWIGLLLHEIVRLLWGRLSFKLLLRVTSIGALGLLTTLTLLPLMGKDSDFLLDANLGGRLNQILLLLEGGVYLFPHKPFSVIAEIAYVSILDTFGVLGLLTFLSALLMPLWIAVRQEGISKNLFSRAIGVVKSMLGSRTYPYVRLRFLALPFLATHPDKRVFRSVQEGLAPYTLPRYKKDILFGLGLYLVVAGSDSASLYVPVMLFYWFGVAMLLREEPL